MTEFHTDPVVRLIGSYGNDRLIAEEAWMSTDRATDDEDKIKKLIDVLVSRKHDKALETVHFHYEVFLPILIDRQLATYRTLVASISNSGRYGATTDDYSIPKEFQELDEEDKIVWYDLTEANQTYYLNMCKKYETLFGKQRCREIFRNKIEQGQFTRRRFIVNLRNLIHMLDERLARHAQYEIQVLAKQMLNLARPVAPYTFESLEKHRGLKLI